MDFYMSPSHYPFPHRHCMGEFSSQDAIDSKALQYTLNPTNSDSKNTLHSTKRVKFPLFLPSLTFKCLASNELISEPSTGSTNYNTGKSTAGCFST